NRRRKHQSDDKIKDRVFVNIQPKHAVFPENRRVLAIIEIGYWLWHQACINGSQESKNAFTANNQGE
ncbi:MAG: hypothetical protein ACI87E_004316, partial [Mariniblastus sp.]